MNSLSLCTLFLTLSLLFIFQSPLPTNARVHGHYRLVGDNPDLINQICSDQSINDKNNCTNIMRADPTIVGAADFFEISLAIFSIGLSKVTEGLNFLNELVMREHVPAIEECARNYQVVLHDIRVALDDLTNNDVDSLLAKYCASDISLGVLYCEDALATAGIVNPTISALNFQTALLSAIASVAISKFSIT